MPPVARVGDTTSHGGSIASGSPVASADGRPVARVGDPFDCPLHGRNPIATGSGKYTQDGRPVARVGDRTECGAVITTGSPVWSSE